MRVLPVLLSLMLLAGTPALAREAQGDLQSYIVKSQRQPPPPIVVPRAAQIEPTEISKVYDLALSGHADSQFRLAQAYTYGHVVGKDPALGLVWQESAAELGNFLAAFDLGFRYQGHGGVPGDSVKAAASFRKAADRGFGSAQNILGNMYAEGRGVPQDYVQAFKWFDLALSDLKPGDIYYEYYSACREYVAARLTATELAEAKALAAAWKPAPLTSTQGVAVRWDDVTDKDLEWLRPLAESGHSGAQVLLGFMYLKGRGVAGDKETAVTWLQKAAESGHVRGQYLLGLSIFQLEGVPQDQAAAVAWFKKAADQGFGEAQYLLGVFYASGLGVPKNSETAIFWLRKAAKQGVGDAQYFLARMLINDRGSEVYPVESYMWLSLSTTYGLSPDGRDKAKEIMALLTTEMSKDQIAEATRRAEAWKPTFPKP